MLIIACAPHPSIMRRAAKLIRRTWMPTIGGGRVGIRLYGADYELRRIALGGTTRPAHDSPGPGTGEKGGTSPIAVLALRSSTPFKKSASS